MNSYRRGKERDRSFKQIFVFSLKRFTTKPNSFFGSRDEIIETRRASFMQNPSFLLFERHTEFEFRCNVSFFFPTILILSRDRSFLSSIDKRRTRPRPLLTSITETLDHLTPSYTSYTASYLGIAWKIITSPR